MAFSFPALRHRASIGLLALLAVACSGSDGPNSAGTHPINGPSPVATVPGWLTTSDGSRRLSAIEASQLQPNARQSADVAVDISQLYQPFSGYGASITDATAWLLMQKLDAADRSDLLQQVFGPGGELGLDLTRITIGASDFSRSHYTYADTVGDPMADITPAKADLIPAIKEIRSINPGLMVIASPWSAPAWMKTSQSLIKGKLDPAHYEDFARYLVSYAKAMDMAGVPVNMLTIQNEPHFEPEDYPGMRVEPAERAAFVGDHLGPLMDREIPQTRLLDWDHNWNEPESPRAVLADRKASPFVDGVAWHCYDGDVSAQSAIHESFPDKETWFTECSAGDWSGDWASAFQWSARNLVIGAPRHWARGVIMWNLALDQNHGPHFGGCANCRGLITISTETGAITREPEYYAFAHGSRFLPDKARRIGAAVQTNGVESVAFLGNNGTKVSLVVFNGSADKEAISFSIAGKTYSAAMPRGSLATYVIAVQAN